MAGSKQKKSFSFFSFFKAKKGQRDQVNSSCSPADESWRGRKANRSEEDSTRRVVAEPDIDNLATAFIINFHAMVGAEGISGGAMKCLEIGKNTNGESTLLGRH
ncbi:hypothetical protein PTKIN_Ptkin01aG0300400 [Pterospermum kingtungense]